MNLESIEATIKKLEQSADTPENVQELANLCIVRDYLQQRKTE